MLNAESKDFKPQQDRLVCDCWVQVNQKLQRQNTTSTLDIKINQNESNFLSRQGELNTMWVENLAAGNTFLVAHAVHMRCSSSHTLIK